MDVAHTYTHLNKLSHIQLHIHTHLYTHTPTPQGLDFRNDLLIFAADAGVDATLTKLGYRTYRHAGLGDFGPDQHMA